jgi:uracil permease
MNIGDSYSLVALSIAAISLASTIFMSVFVKGFFKVIPILGGMLIGYFFTLIMGFFFPVYNIIDFSIVTAASWFNTPTLVLPQFNLAAIVIFIIVSIATIIEHFGDIFAVSAITGRKLYENPGAHRTLIGDGLATSLAALFGGPPNTSYGENVGVMAITKVYSVWVIIGAAIIAIFLSFFGKFGALIQTIPFPVLGGVCMLLFCLIAAQGLRMLVSAGVDYKDNRNLCVTACVLAPAIGGLVFSVGQFSISGIALGAVLGVIVNLIINRPSKDS